MLRFRYNKADVHGVLHEMDAALEGLVDEMARTSDWDRAFTRQPGEQRTVRWLVTAGACTRRCITPLT